MTGLVLVTLLNLAPGIQLADNVASRHVALSEARFQLVSDDEDAPRPTLDSMTREQLAVELRRLDDTRPGLGGPIAMLSVGVVLAVPGVALGILGLSLVAVEAGMKAGAGTAVGYLVMAGGGVFVLVGTILLIVGVVKLIKRIGARREHTEEVNQIQQRLDTLDQQPAPLPGPPPVPPPAPELAAPPPPQASWVVPGELITLATF
ncbi:MAG: hypothetical protein H6Q89_3644 [Myxococcaceae bacterium]|nr:hypothetical protein [Myxococcaceae bacterium]